jgi:hypothetical protein
MTLSLRTQLRAVLATLAGVAMMLAAMAIVSSPATAQGTAPPWAPGGVSPDPNAKGGLTFYNASGAPITTGSTTTAPFAAYAQGRVAPRTSVTDTKATLYAYVPQAGQTPDQWTVNEQIGLSTTYPNPAAPAPLTTSPLPVNSGSDTDLKLSTVASDIVNPSTTAGYQNVYEIRMRTGAPFQATSAEYDYADISIDSAAHTWTLVFTPGEAPAQGTPPAAPTGVLATAGDHSASLSWTAPTDHGDSDITGYNVQYSSNDGGTWTDGPIAFHSSTATTGTVSGLTNGATYVFRVAAINNAGDGAYSVPSNAVTLPTSTATTLAVTPSGHQAPNGTVTLTATVTPNSAIGAVQFKDGAATLNAPVPVVSGSAHTTTTFANTGTHSFTATFSPTVATAFAASTSTAVTYLIGTAPGAPTGVNPKAGNGTVRVSWTAPTSTGGSPITGYDVQYSANGGAFVSGSSAFHTSTATAQTVTGLHNGTAYKFRVAAINKIGTGQPSAASASVTPRADGSSLTAGKLVTLARGKTAALSTRLKDTTTGKFLAGQSVALRSRVGAKKAWVAVKTVKTSSNGTAKFSVKPLRNTQYEWFYAGNTAHASATSAVQSVHVAQTVAAHASPASLKHGKSTKIYGTVAPSVSGERVYLQQKVNGKWANATSVRTKQQKLPNGHKSIGFVFTVKEKARGRFTYRVYAPASSTCVAGYSGAVTVKAT